MVWAKTVMRYVNIYLHSFARPLFIQSEAVYNSSVLLVKDLTVL